MREIYLLHDAMIYEKRSKEAPTAGATGLVQLMLLPVISEIMKRD